MERQHSLRVRPPGDLYVVIHVAEHKQFERQGSNLYASVPITFAQAALGSEIPVKTLDDEEKLKTITAYEKRAVSAMSVIEG